MREDFGLRFDRTHLVRQDDAIEFVGQACLGQERADIYPDVGHHNDRDTALSKLGKHWHRVVKSHPLISHDGIQRLTQTRINSREQTHRLNEDLTVPDLTQITGTSWVDRVSVPPDLLQMFRDGRDQFGIQTLPLSRR